MAINYFKCILCTWHILVDDDDDGDENSNLKFKSIMVVGISVTGRPINSMKWSNVDIRIHLSYRCVYELPKWVI